MQLKVERRMQIKRLNVRSYSDIIQNRGKIRSVIFAKSTEILNRKVMYENQKNLSEVKIEDDRE